MIQFASYTQSRKLETEKEKMKSFLVASAILVALAEAKVSIINNIEIIEVPKVT